MALKWIGAVLVISGCGGWGLLLARGYRRQEIQLDRLGRLLRMMRWELSYRLTPLPELCRNAGLCGSGVLRHFFLDLARELNHNTFPNASGCVGAVLKRYENLPPRIRRILRHLGSVLGRFDLEGQLQGMDSILAECESEKVGLEKDREIRLRSYRTLGLCAGVALVILFA